MTRSYILTRRQAIAVLAGFPGSTAAACRERAGTPPGARRAPITLEIWSRLRWVKDLAERYTAGPGAARQVTLAPTTLGSPLEFQEKLIAAVAGNTAPDFTTIELNISPLFNVQGVYADLSREYKGLARKEQFPPAMVRYGGHAGKVYQVPFWVDTSGLFWNKGHFAAAGLDPEKPPQTWEQLIRLAQQVSRPGEADGVAIPYNGSPTWQFMPWVYANGGRLLSDDGTQVLVNSPEALGAFELWADLAQKYRVTPEGFRTRTAFNATDLFTTGRLAMYHTGAGLLNTLKRTAPDLPVGTAVLPVGPLGKRTGCAPGGDTMGILPQTKDRAACWALLEWLLSDEVQVEHIVAQGYGLPMLAGQFDNRYFKEDPRFLPFREAAQAATPTWTTKFEQLKAVMLPEYMAAITGQKEPRVALRDMAEAIARELAKA
jgi:multiple sugar transport system substrate-binding protein